MRVYTGFRLHSEPTHPEGWATVTVREAGDRHGHETPEFHAARNDPEGGLEWWNNVDGQLRLAWELLTDALNLAKPLHPNIYGAFTEEVIYRFPKEGWDLTEEEIRKKVEELQVRYAIMEHDEAVDAAV